jgi:hypothetical protein
MAVLDWTPVKGGIKLKLKAPIVAMNKGAMAGVVVLTMRERNIRILFFAGYHIFAGVELLG